MGLRLTSLKLVITFFFGHGSCGFPPIPGHPLRPWSPFFAAKELPHWWQGMDSAYSC